MARSSKGFLQTLFDFSFSEFITPKIAGVLYAIAVIVIGLVAVFAVLGSLASGSITTILGTIIFAPLGFLLYVLFVRVALESMVAAMYTANNTAQIAENTRRDF